MLLHAFVVALNAFLYDTTAGRELRFITGCRILVKLHLCCPLGLTHDGIVMWHSDIIPNISVLATDKQ
jgi:hypothetical protein